jgi:crotonobetainyl-CoA:carnitine CoA-transferase CaiB-like acyl-CoA transferase
MASSLDGIRVLDLSRVLAGPVCTQILADLGAEIIKVEKPGEGDDTRLWGPPFLKDRDGRDTTESAYYLSCNRGKKSLALDISKPEGQAIIHKLAEESDILIHNFKVGSLDKFGLGYDSMQEKHPHLVYTAISGFGQTGPLAREPGYDLLTQAMGGLMAHTGDVEGDPMKVGVAVSDVMTGLYAAIGTLAALNARTTTGKGQLVDVALLDVTLASMTNLAQFFLTSGKAPKRFGNAHSTIVPYQAFEASDGHFVIAVGNDHQFQRLCKAIGHEEWATDPRYAHNSARVANRDILVPMLSKALKEKTVTEWIDLFRDIDIPAAPVNRIDEVFEIDQVQARSMEIEIPHSLSPGPIHLVGSPLKLSDTPVTYSLAPPTLGQHSEDILRHILNMDDAEIRGLKQAGVI